MLRYIGHRAPSLVGVLLVSSLLIFGIIRLIPGDPAATLAGPDSPPEAVAAIRHELGLDQPFVAQYLTWLGQLVTFDLGRSYLVGGEIATLVSQSFGSTVLLAATALLIAVLLSLVLGPLWASTRNRALEAALTAANTVAVAVPTFVIGVGLIVVLGVAFRLLPVGGVPPDGFFARIDITAQYLLMPALCLALPTAAVLTRYVAERVRTELRQPYITTAVALGVSRRRITYRHALRNALPTAVTVLGVQVGNLLGGAVLVETVFSWPGLGQLIGQAISRRDYPVVQVLLLLSVVTYAVIQLLSDVMHAYLDSRVRLGGIQ